MADYNPFDVVDDSEDSNTESTDTFNAFEPSTSSNNKTNEQSMNTSNSELDNTSNNKKHNIIDMYWLINNKLFENKKLETNEIALLTIGYNADFNNLRIGLFEPNNKTFTEHAIYKTEAKLITTVNVFSETAHKALSIINKGENADIINFERVFSQAQANSWKPSPSLFKINLSEKNITLEVTNNNTKYTYVFTDWQIAALLSVFKYMTNGGSWSASLK